MTGTLLGQKWRKLYEPFYPEPPSNVTVIRDQQYGPFERNYLDVFVPNEMKTEKPVLMYVHGGGFFSGDKMWSEKVYSNIGWFFARHGIVTVILNHRLVPNVRYPGGADDIQMAREWIFNHISSPKYGCGSVNKVVLFGHSSGGAHIAANLYAAGKSLSFNHILYATKMGR